MARTRKELKKELDKITDTVDIDFTNNIIEFINNTFTSGIIFSIVFVLTLSEASPLLKSGRTIYAILTGILLTIFVNIFKINIGIYFVILIMSIISPLINKLKISISK